MSLHRSGLLSSLFRVNKGPVARHHTVEFLVVITPLAYNAIIGRPTLNALKAVVAVHMLLVQYETDDGKAGKLYGDQRVGRECYFAHMKEIVPEVHKGKKEEGD